MHNSIFRGLSFRFIFWSVYLIVLSSGVTGQLIKSPKYTLELGGLESVGRQTPFWLVSNQYGRNSTRLTSGFVSASVYSDPDTSRIFSLGYGLELFDRNDGNNSLWIYQSFVKVKYRFLHLRVGSEEETYGNQDSALSSGSMMWSQNTRPMPKIVIATNGYIDVPFTRGYVQFSGLLSHGWFGDDGYVKGTYLHHKFVYIKVGGKLPVNLSMGLQHYAMWGGVSSNASVGRLPSDFKTYVKVFFAQSNEKNDTSLPLNERLNKIGNHLGSWNYGIDVKLDKYLTGLYYQTIFEDYSGYSKFFMPDGLWGFYLKTKDARKLIHALTYEYIHTSYQSGPPGPVSNQFTKGNDNYFNNGIYASGWTYNKFTIGTPLISSPAILKGNSISIINNRVIAHQIGIQGMVNESTSYRILLTASKNYMKYPAYGQPYPKPVPVESFLVELRKSIKKIQGLEIATQIAFDHGELYGNNGGILIVVRKSGSFFRRTMSEK